MELCGVSLLRDTLLAGPLNKACSLLGSTLGSPFFGKLPYKDYLDWDYPCKPVCCLDWDGTSATRGRNTY